MRWGSTGLSDEQVEVVRASVPGARVLANDSWGLLDTVVLHVAGTAGEYTVKAAGPENTHFPRELLAHRRWTAPFVRTGDTAALVAADEERRVLVLDRVPGHLALGSPDETSPDVHRQAGALLRRFHDQNAAPSDDFLVRESRKALDALASEHRIPDDIAARARAHLLSFDAGPVTLVPTHGDWHPRNWIVDDGRLRMIDFGRFALRPRALDLTRLAVLHWQHEPALERAFFDGYGDDPRDPEAWRWLQLREAVGTAVWAYAVGDERFEDQGHRMLADALAAFDHGDPLR
ncbi:aminoglycoside phosphotransferase [Curtobacterium sp. PhB130]|uniref:aminoglycoside phosphotransferase family protein n=1 Tax=Curtobacterium sp. PhB130 TaxID=2485178 RepID=UPI000F4C0D67|nr:aminoglycoside phosphotransferase family protein [Curtobacterium sp. PhB130]ROS77790.1 aminoglycoside phosphotransferase [Curtobacterium sp. PhB130]